MKSKSSPSPEESRRSGEGLASAITISLLSMLLYVNTLNHQFVYDDRYLTRRIIHQNIVIICQSARRRAQATPTRVWKSKYLLMQTPLQSQAGQWSQSIVFHFYLQQSLTSFNYECRLEMSRHV